MRLPTTLLPLLALLPTLSHAQSTVTAASTLTVAGPTVTSILASATTPPSPQYTDDHILRTSVLNSTNFFRFQHNASFLSWNTSLASYASTYAARCLWSHSQSPQGYGENLARGYPDMTSAIDAWGNERSLYTFSPPSSVTGFSEDTGHFTQLVWKFTQSVGCGVYACNGQNGIGGYMVVCEYWPPGNIEMAGRDKNEYFESQVQSQVHQGAGGFSEASATAGASGVTGWATGSLTAAQTGSGTSSGGAQRTVGRNSWVGIAGVCLALHGAFA